MKLFPRRYSRRALELTANLHLVLRLRMRGAAAYLYCSTVAKASRRVEQPQIILTLTTYVHLDIQHNLKFNYTNTSQCMGVKLGR
jgi:hypothetical protein